MQLAIFVIRDKVLKDHIALVSDDFVVFKESVLESHFIVVIHVSFNDLDM